MDSNPVAVAQAFVAAINRHSVAEIAELMSEDHVFIDSDGTEVRGKPQMRAGWEHYLRMFPDYRIVIEEAYSQGQNVVLLGTAQGTYAVDGKLLAQNRWSVPAAWRAKIGQDRVLEWRVYVNVEPIREILSRAQA